jgi:choline kinase
VIAPEESTLVLLAAGRGKRFGGCKPLAPVGPNLEALIDVVASDAIAAGFGRLVVVVNPDTGPLIRSHVARSWPSEVAVEFCVQQRPTGTVGALVAARGLVEPGDPFGVANGDDIYGFGALEMLHRHLSPGTSGTGVASPEAPSAATAEHVLVAFRLAATIVSDDPVTRGICEIDSSEHLIALTERRQIARDATRGEIRSSDGHQPEALPAKSLVSLNLWGFQADIWTLLAEAISTSERHRARDGESQPELLLPEVVGSLLAGSQASRQGQPPFRALVTDSRCIGVTHAADLPIVQGELAMQVVLGVRPPVLWDLDDARRAFDSPNASVA